MKIIISTFMIFIGTVLCAQVSKLETIYNQIPPIQDKLLCDRADNYIEIIALIGSLSSQLEEMRLHLNEELKINGDETYNVISAGFPTDEELKKVEKLSEAEQQAFWEKIEANQNHADIAIADNLLKYQDEKESLNKKVTDYQNELFAITEEFIEIHHKAMEVKTDKRQHIYNTCMANNSLTAYGEQQMEQIKVEFCSAVSPAILKRLSFEYGNLKQNMSLYRRLIIIELMEFSNLKEEDVHKQNVRLLELNDLEILAQFMNNYGNLFNILPGSIDN